MHFVQTLIVFGLPSTIALTRFMLGLHILFDFLFEWLTLEPCATPLLHISHVLANGNTSLLYYHEKQFNFNIIY